MPNPGKKILSDLYNVKDGSLRKTGKVYGVSGERVRQWMERWDLPRNGPGIKSILDESNIEICDKYIKGEPVVKLAKKHEVCAVTIYKFLLECNPDIGLERKQFREKLRRNNG